MNSRYKNIDNDNRGVWQSGDLVASETRKDGNYDVVSPVTGKFFNAPIGKHWVYSQENMKKLIEENRIWFGKDGNAFPRKKRFLTEVKEGRKVTTWWTSDEVGHNQEGKRELKNFFEQSELLFSTPKPLRLIRRILELSTNENNHSLVLDFFAGSGTTAHAVMQLNAEDGGNRQCILVTNNENKICEDVTFERCRRVIEGYTTPKGELIQGLEGNNLRYFKTDFVPYTLNNDQLRFSITGKCTEMLCLRENVFDLFAESKAYKIYKEGDKHVAIYYDMYSLEFEQLRDVMNGIEGEKILYFFSLDREPNLSDFSQWKAIKIEPIPQKILDLYRQLFKERKP